MEVQKRKRIDDNEEIDNKEVKIIKEDEENKGTMVDDDEVEQFFAILKRIRVAVKYFEKANNAAVGGGAGKKLTAEKPQNIPAFLPGDFEGQECVEDNVGVMDLNADAKKEKKISSSSKAD
ncbi:hypothetical protein K7X08_001185 [Anisodus acutangulus]|uniref:Uncharacterized protein n=1 Tax=Anisodus acutangulus TaxID=402998 RepID=A0A9Q1RKD4_9SOLA|nr:hypothetical protein K7X08_001185 [Anisodus acutangulus]